MALFKVSGKANAVKDNVDLAMVRSGIVNPNYTTFRVDHRPFISNLNANLTDGDQVTVVAGDDTKQEARVIALRNDTTGMVYIPEVKPCFK